MDIMCSGRKEKTTLPDNLPSYNRQDFSSMLINLDFSQCNIRRVEQRAYFGEVNAIQLAGNRISVIEEDAIRALLQRADVDLRDNRIRTIPKIDDIRLTRGIKLSQNPWTCSVKYRWFQKWANDNRDHITDYDNIKCGYCAGGNGREDIKLVDAAECFLPEKSAGAVENPSDTNEEKETSFEYIILGACIVMSALIGVVIYCCHRRRHRRPRHLEEHRFHSKANVYTRKHQAPLRNPYHTIRDDPIGEDPMHTSFRSARPRNESFGSIEEFGVRSWNSTSNVNVERRYSGSGTMGNTMHRYHPGFDNPAPVARQSQRSNRSREAVPLPPRQGGSMRHPRESRPPIHYSLPTQGHQTHRPNLPTVSGRVQQNNEHELYEFGSNGVTNGPVYNIDNPNAYGDVPL